MKTPSEIWKKIIEIDDLISVENSSKSQDSLILEKNTLILDLAKSCGRKRFDNCLNRYLKCSICTLGDQYLKR